MNIDTKIITTNVSSCILIMPPTPKDVQILIPRTFEHVILHGERDFPDVIVKNFEVWRLSCIILVYSI